MAEKTTKQSRSINLCSLALAGALALSGAAVAAAPAVDGLTGGEAHIALADTGTVQMSAKAKSVFEKGAFKLKLTNLTGKHTVKWSTTNSKVAKVDKNGRVTAVAPGTCYVKAKHASKTYKCKVTVKAGLSATSKTIHAGATATLKCKAWPASDHTVKWTSTNTDVAKVDQSGKITAKNAGTCYVKATHAGKTYKCKVKVEAARHTWKTVRKTVWEPNLVTVVDQEAYDEVVRGADVIKCSCGKEFSTDDEFYNNHQIPMILKGEYAHQKTVVKGYPSVVHHERVTHQEDHGRYVTVVDGHVCRYCGAKMQ